MYGKYNSGVASLSPNVAAAEQWAKNKGIPPDQLVNFFVSLGNPELAGLIATKVRTEKAAKAEQALAQQPPAAPPTVADEYRMIEQQQAQQAMAAQMAQMQQARMAQAAPGLPGMPNPAMDRANFAGGGIVAFADGGDVQHFAIGGLTTAEAAEYAQLKDKALRYSQMMGSGGIGAVAGMSFDRTRLNQLQDKINAAEYASALQRRAAIDPRAAIELRNLEASGALTAPAAAPTSPAPAAAPTPPAAPAAPAATTKPDAGILAAANAATRDAYAGKAAAAGAAAPTPPAAPAAQSNIQSLLDTYRAEIGDAPTPYKETKFTSPSFNEEKTFIEGQRKSATETKKGLTSELFIKTGLDLIGSSDPNVLRAIGTSAGKNYAEMRAELKQLTKEHDALRLQEIKLNQAMEQAQRTQNKEDRDRADKAAERYQDRLDGFNKLQVQAKLDLAQLKSLEARTMMTTAATAGGRENTRDIQAFNAEAARLNRIAATALEEMKATYDPIERAAAKKRYEDAMNSLSALQFGGVGGGAGVTKTTASGTQYTMEP